MLPKIFVCLFLVFLVSAFICACTNGPNPSSQLNLAILEKAFGGSRWKSCRFFGFCSGLFFDPARYRDSTLKGRDSVPYRLHHTSVEHRGSMLKDKNSVLIGPLSLYTIALREKGTRLWKAGTQSLIFYSIQLLNTGTRCWKTGTQFWSGPFFFTQ